MSKKMTKEEIHSGLESILGTLTEDVTKALDIKEAKKQLEQKIEQLKREEIQLKDVVSHLKITREKLLEELKRKEKQEEELQSKVFSLKEDRAKLEAEKLALEDEIKNLKKEKEMMQQSLEKTNDMLVRLKHHIEEFDEELKK